MEKAMEQYGFRMIPKRTRILGIVTGGAVLILAFAVILPGYLAVGRVKKEVAVLQAELEASRLLNPLYETLIGQAKEMPGRGGLGLLEKMAVRRRDISRLPVIFNDMASASGIVMNSCEPDVRSMGGAGGFIGVDLRVTGGFLELRDFLVRIGGLPSLKRVGKIQIQAGPVSESCSVKLFLGLEDSYG